MGCRRFLALQPRASARVEHWRFHERRSSASDAYSLCQAGRQIFFRVFRVFRGEILGRCVCCAAELISLLYVLFRHPRILSRALGDVRLYLDPKGEIERVIVQRIDKRVGENFLRLIGLDWNF